MIRNFILTCIFFFLFSGFVFAKNDIDLKISQMIIIGFDGDNVKSHGFKKVKKQLKHNKISGVIFFDKNLHEPKLVGSNGGYDCFFALICASIEWTCCMRLSN